MIPDLIFVLQSVGMFVIPALIGGGIAAVLWTVRQKLVPDSSNWPLLVSLAALGNAANNTSAVWFAGGDAIFDSNGWDNMGAGITGMLLGLMAVGGIAVSLFLNRKSPAPRRPHPLWGWVLVQGAVSCVIFLLGSFVHFGRYSSHSLSLPVYLVVMTVLIFALSALAGGQLGDRPHAALFSLGVCGLMSGLSLGLMVSMRANASVDPSWGLDLIQSAAGTWFARLNLPAAVLIGDYQYDWNITAPLLYLSAIASNLLFAAGWLCGRLIARQKGNAQ